MPRKLEAQFDGRYLMSSVLMTSTMKSDPATPPIRLSSGCGTLVSAAMVCAVGGSAEGRRVAAEPSATAAFACGASVPAALATATAARNLRRSTFGLESFVPRTLRVMMRSLGMKFLAATQSSPRAGSADCIAAEYVAPGGRRNETDAAHW